MRVLVSLAIAVVFASADALAQTTTDDKAWSFSASAYTYILPDSGNYGQPTFTADRGWLHLEARYNYEALDTDILAASIRTPLWLTRLPTA